MATKDQLRAAFQSQGANMNGCCSEAAEPLAAECLGLTGRRQQIATRVGAWNALPESSPTFDPVAGLLHDSAARLAGAGNDQQCSAAIASAHHAIDALEQLLDATAR